MSELSQLKGELKAWERAFHAAHDGRDPTREEMKREPEIASKYKRYRALTKGLVESSTTASIKHASQPSKPRPTRGTEVGSDPKRHGEASFSSVRALLQKSKPVESPSKPSTSNPFSPVKRPARRNTRAITPDDEDLVNDSSSRDVNPFLVSPTRSSLPPKSSLFSAERLRASSSSLRSNPKKKPQGPPSSPPASPVKAPTFSQPRSTNRSGYDFVASPQKLRELLSSGSRSGSSSALTPRTKARKRMRGEDVPITPSEAARKKRHRISSFVAQGESYQTDEDPYGGGEEEEALPESPMKLPAVNAGKQGTNEFRPIFSETTVPSVSLFGALGRGRGPIPRKPTEEARAEPKTLGSASLSGNASKRSYDGNVKGILPDDGASTTAQGAKSGVHPNDLFDNETDMDIATKGSFYEPLRPPSPPLDTRTDPSGKGKGKEQWATTRMKKLRTEEETTAKNKYSNALEDGQNDASGDLTVLQWQTGKRRNDVETEEDDPVGGDLDEENVAEGEIQISLPDEIRRVLAVSSPDARREREEREIAARLLEGRPVDVEGKFAPVFGAGEWMSEDEDDWDSVPEGWDEGH